MARLQFKSGSALNWKTVSLTAAQAGVTSGPVEKANYGSNAEVMIALRSQQPLAVAPMDIYLDAAVSGFVAEAPALEEEFDPTFSDIEYLWSIEKVGDPTWQTTIYPKLEKVPVENRVKGTKFGQRISHIFGPEDLTGDSSVFRFTVTAIEVATGATATSTSYDVTVAHPDAYWSAAETFVVRKSAATEGWPTTSNSIYSTIAAAVTAASQASQSETITKARICVENGQDYEEGILNFYGSLVGWAMYGWGAGYRYTSTTGDFNLCRGNSTNQEITSVQICGLRRNAPLWNGVKLNARPSEPVTHYTLWDCEIENTYTLYSTEGGAFTGYLTFGNTSGVDHTAAITGGIVTGLATQYIGCSLKHTSVLPSDQKGGGGYGLRPERTRSFLFSQSEIFVRQGWFNNAPGIQTTQPVIRLWFSGHYVGARGLMERSYFEGLVTVNGERTSEMINLVFSRNVHVGVHDTGYFIDNLGMSVVRDSFFIRPPSPPANRRTGNLFSTAAFIQLRAHNATSWGDRVGKAYGNTFISLMDIAAPVIFEKVPGAGTMPPDYETSNNVIHAPNATVPLLFGDFMLTANADPYYDGYDDRRGSPGLPRYKANIQDATLVGTFQVGETVKGQTSLVEKVFVGEGTRFQSGVDYIFEASGVVFARLDEAPGFERFLRNEVIEGLTSGATVQLMDSSVYGQSFDTGLDLIGLIPDTVTPTHRVGFSGAGGFVPGETATTATGSATVCQVVGSILYLSGITGTISAGQAITSASGSGTTSTAAVTSGVGDLWTPTTNNAPDALYSPYDLICRARNAGNAIKGALVDA